MQIITYLTYTVNIKLPVKILPSHISDTCKGITSNRQSTMRQTILCCGHCWHPVSLFIICKYLYCVFFDSRHIIKCSLNVVVMGVLPVHTLCAYRHWLQPLQF